MAVDRAAMNKKLFAALKPGGFLVIADHSAKPGDGASVGKTLHRIEEALLKREIEAAGFKLAAADFLRHPEDPARRAGLPSQGAGRRVRAEIRAAALRSFGHPSHAGSRVAHRGFDIALSRNP